MTKEEQKIYDAIIADLLKKLYQAIANIINICLSIDDHILSDKGLEITNLMWKMEKYIKNNWTKQEKRKTN